MKVKFFSFIGLLISFALLFAALPLAHDYDFLGVFMLLAFTSIIFFSVYAVAENRVDFIIAICLAVPGALIHWIEALDNSFYAQIIDMIFSMLLYCYVSYIILKYIFHTKVVSVNVIYGAVCVYMLFGFIWATAFTILETASPGSFSGLDPAPTHFNYAAIVNYHIKSLFYFSYITLTTLGYGNIAPNTVAASAMAAGEAIVGQLYITILIARLVGLHISQHAE